MHLKKSIMLINVKNCIFGLCKILPFSKSAFISFPFNLPKNVFQYDIVFHLTL